MLRKAASMSSDAAWAPGGAVAIYELTVNIERYEMY